MVEENKDNPNTDDVENADVIDESGTDAPTEDAMFDDIDAVADPSIGTARPSRLPAFLAFLALLLSAVSLAGVAWIAFLKQEPVATEDNDDARLAAQAQAIDANSAALDDLRQSLADAERDLQTATRTGTGDIEAFERRLEQRLRGLESVPPRIASLESSMSALRGISTGARDAWLLAEASYYLQIANAQLQLAGNPELALLALRIADERLLELGDPGLTDVRRALSDELRSLEVIEAPDIEGATLTLASLSQVVDSLPVRQEVMTSDPTATSDAADLTGTDRAMASLKDALSDVVSVRRVDEAARPLIAPEAIYFLRANLALQLQAARLALLRGEQALFQQSLDDASAWLREYYDTESAPVRSALQTIGEIRDSSFTRAMPDISESLRLLRQYMAFVGTADAETAPIDVQPEPAGEATATDPEPQQ